MVNISYTESIPLKTALRKIDLRRSELLLSVISPENEIYLRWISIIERVYYALSLTNSPLTKGDVTKVLNDLINHPFSMEEQDAFNFKKALDMINEKWISSKKHINISDITELNQKLNQGKLNIKADDLTHSLSYFQNSNEHPVIQAGLAHYQIYALSSANNRNTRFSSLISYLFLYKEGYDFRGLLIIDDYLRRNYADYILNLDQAVQTGAQTIWLEFFSKAVLTSLDKSLERINKDNSEALSSPLAQTLTQRQKEILSLLDNPESSINNRQVQKIFKISQITASRDLSKLASLLLIFPHGKGRSIYYTKV